MYWEIKGGTKVTIYTYYDCWIPPVGYGCHSETGAIEKTDILKRSTKKAEQYWERTPLPADYTKKAKEELKKQEADPDYYDEQLDAFRAQEWKRRLYGVWFYNNGEPTYITGEHYMYLNWWALDDGYPEYRDPDRRRYYVQQYCIQDPRCAGLIEAANRRSGKSYRGGLFSYDYTSRSKDTNSGIQSKTDPDAKNLFKGKIVTPFKRLPDFFRPEIDTMAGNNPDKEIKFTTTTRKGKKAMDNFDVLGLNSYIDYKSSEQYAYDGWKLHRYLGDEVGKTERVDVYDRWNVVKYCLTVGGKWIGKALLTTTVEKIGDEKDNQTQAFEMLWIESDPTKRNANGHTSSGLYKYFTPAYEMKEFDKYGMPEIEASKKFYMNTRAGYANNPRALASEIAKNPFTEQELFASGGDKCLYDSTKLREQQENISWRVEQLLERGRFAWKDGVRFSEIVWIKDIQGRFQICKDFVMKDANKVVQRAGAYIPNNNYNFRIGCDPFKYDKTKDNRRSDCAASVYKLFDPTDKDNPFNDAFVCRYVHRASTTAQQYEDILMMCWYFGCQVLFEANVDNWKDYFRMNNCWSFLMILEGETEPGIVSDGYGRTHQYLANVTEAYIEAHIKKVYFPTKIRGWLEFDIGNTTKFDEAMADGYTLIAASNTRARRAVEATHDVTNYFKQYSVA